MKINGVEVANVTHDEPRNNLPKWVRQAAESRGYGDARVPLSLYITKDDVAAAFDCAAHGNGEACVMAQAGKRLGAKSVYFYRTTAWVDFGEGPIVRFETSPQIYKNVIDPFDRGDRGAIAPGIYHLTPPSPGRTLVHLRRAHRKQPRRSNVGSPRKTTVVAHTERVIMGARSGGDA